MITYEIKGGDLPILICYPKAGQCLKTERGAMSWMSPNMKLHTKSKAKLGNILGRATAGEPIFLNEYRAENEAGMIAFTAKLPGSIIPIHVTPENDVVIQKKGFLAMEDSLNMSVALQKKLTTGLFSGKGFAMQRVSGEGLIFLEINGALVEYELQAGQSMVLNTDYVAAYTGGCTMTIEPIKGINNILFGGEGLFNTIVTGPGHVYLQSMPINGMANAINPYTTPKG